MPDSPPPASVYAERLTARRAAAEALAHRLETLSYARLGVFAAGLVAAGIGFGTSLLSPWFALVPLAAFVYLVAKFEMTRGRLAWTKRSAAFYAAGADRLAGKPSGAADGARFLAEDHPYAADLDLFGPGSLFERLTVCRTAVGEETLAAWLAAPAPPAEVKARQEAVADLRTRLDLREAVAVAGADVPAADYAPLVAWGSAPTDVPPAWKRVAVEVVGWGNVAAWLGWLVVGTTALPVLVFGLPSLVLAAQLLPWARRVLSPLEPAAEHLSLLEALLARVHREGFTAPRLRELQVGLAADGVTASAQIRELRVLLEWYNSRRNALFIPVAILRLWDVRFAFKLEAWRSRSGPAVGRWLRAVAEVEALSSLAGYAYENPTDVFPTVEPGPARVAAVGVGHPLIPAEKCVRNDVTLGGTDGPRLLLISGSNMSGKSTLLRAVGVNAVLALAGGVVRAGAFALSPLALGATMRVQDSLQAGRSRFYAEVTKVRQVLDLARKGEPPLLFLLDEIFSGTNSADRVAGAEGVLKTLLAAGAIGFVTTHDLSLTGVAGRLPGTVNVHFCDGFAGGELRFDYTMRPGVVAHGNGLALMRAVGLEV
ncbi:dna mismatch repair protein : Mismatch repair ATPase (MutS family) OS=Singulisphaera acidiphila (strain ATCC BAA-1392 / DSM 18658 / VKM B-2454 / MOB10) GN=Sinac_5331 PE=4 SV=1: MutS_V [Gemmataceae bacterium]|nr:dna mismatch repair protein : Mismatch repair ATPase (MutS family) OS=Singulisphaera acidiphila (strain ATCC BAA-1392 / DSM 18658 / VKM B-2454 / MOB10) GN=Sinac_5331 PE=4 SV=1: MutS_V [Gemmataceae bacterium]VTU01611.1 dna mismatch repair protein : Mismatch repair ATPase (MutS family) OS=Singulisphaera acidiphila (strain ATCC BAA-1392 / DSM 18658 / VKM B-2454 / MOB10) GN=Sinac_5331 PE=4 SV=1: MutS_V [Gemmataceae bacterium]